MLGKVLLPNMKTHLMRGRIEPLVLIDVLAGVARNAETGILKVNRGEAKKSVVIHLGNIVFARSNQKIDRLGDMLLNLGKITPEQYDSATVLLRKKGYRHGRSLVEIGAISPKDLWMAIQEQIKMIAYSVIPWQEGTFEFVKQEIKQKEQITLELPVMELLVDVIRHYDDRRIFGETISDRDAIYRATEGSEEPSVTLEAYEKYVLDFFNGTSSVKEICEISDLGTQETLRVAFLLQTLGLIGKEEKSSDAGLDLGSFVPCIERYNSMYAYLNSYMTDHLGNVGTSLMRKYLDETRGVHPQIFGDVVLDDAGTLPMQGITDNLKTMDGDEAQLVGALEEALTEYLYACILVVKKTLGTEHETIVVQKLESLN